MNPLTHWTKATRASFWPDPNSNTDPARKEVWGTDGLA